MQLFLLFVLLASTVFTHNVFLHTYNITQLFYKSYALDSNNRHLCEPVGGEGTRFVAAGTLPYMDTAALDFAKKGDHFVCMELLFSYWWLLVPAIVMGFIAQQRVRKTYAVYGKKQIARDISGARMARYILDSYNLRDVSIERISGNLTDHYDPRSKTLRLSSDVYNGASVAAMGIAAHEAGHAIQHARSYAPLAIRNTVYPVASFGSNLGPILVIGGLFLGSIPVLINIGIVLFSFAVIFSLFTLPVEFNASNRAMQILTKTGALSGRELRGAQKVLSAAALTYVASALASILTLVRLILLSRSR